MKQSYLKPSLPTVVEVLLQSRKQQKRKFALTWPPEDKRLLKTLAKRSKKVISPSTVEIGRISFLFYGINNSPLSF
jgi:hypothetical protein